MKSIIRRIAQFALATTETPKAATVTQVRTIPAGVGTRKQSQRGEYTVGHRPACDIDLASLKCLESQRIKDAIFNYAAWLSLARAFNTFTKTVSKRAQGQQALDVARELNEFHDWNASMTNPMDAARIEEIVAKLASPTITKENAQTDAILARIKGLSIAQVQEQRIAQAEAKAKDKEAKITAFLTEVEGMADAEECGNPSINATTATLKAIDCLQWLANRENPDMGELIIAEADIATLEAYAHAADLKAGAGESSREIDDALLNSQEMHQGAHHSHM